MTTEQTAQQLELAAQILRTGHPWGYRRIAGSRYKYNTPIEVVADGNLLIPLLATPPDNRPLHNPDNLTAEQVGVGYRLTVEGESVPVVGAEWWCRSSSAWLTSPGGYLPQRNSVRVPLKTPWPEPADPFAELKAAHAAGKVIQILNHQNRYVDADPTWTSPVEYYRIKPEAPPFQPSDQAHLPPPPPGMQWHRTDGWKDGDLPSGYRPLVAGENWLAGDEIRRSGRTHWEVAGTPGDIIDDPVSKKTSPFRTTRPLTFEHGGKTWTYHRPGYPMPCDGGSLIWVLYDEGTHSLNSYCANDYVWGRVVGWRYAEPQTKTVPLGPEDVPPGSVFRRKEESGDYIVPTSVYVGGIYGHDEIVFRHTWAYLMSEYQINRSLPLTGKWNPDAWEPCHKKYDC